MNGNGNGTNELSRADIAAKHLVGNLWYNLSLLPSIAGRLNPTIMRKAVAGPAALAYSEMCRMLQEGRGLSAGQLEANLKDTGFDFGWIQKAQADITNDGLEELNRYVGEVQNASDLLDMRVQCENALKQAGKPDAQADSIKAGLLSSMVDKERRTDEAYHISDIIDEVRDDFAAMRAGLLQWGASTGLASLDKHILLNDGDYITIGARPGQGKTSLMRWMFYKRAEKIQRDGENACVLLFSADDTRKKIARTLASTVAQVDSKRLRANIATDEEWKRLEDAFQYVSALPFFVIDATGLTVEDIHYRTAMQNARKPVVLLGFDYLEKIRGYNENDLSRVRASADGCKSIGKVFNCPFVMASQLTKEVESRADKWPTASDLKYAGEDESDIVLLLNRPEHYISKGQSIDCKPGDESGIVLVNVAKNKEGDVGLVRLGFKKEFARFADLEFTRHELN